MLKRAHVIDFQSVRDLEIDLDAKIVLLSGPSDNGKSAILRAIKNAIFDGVGGSFYRIEEGKKKTQMAVTIESDRGKIQWDKSTKNATYTINETDVRDNCGKTVPKEVPEVVGLTSQNDMGENLHYRNQFQAAFLINDRGTKDAYRFISKLMGADIAIQGMYALEKSVRTLAGEIKVTEEFLQKAEEELGDFYPVEKIKDLEDSYVAMEGLFNKQEDLAKQQTILFNLHEKIVNLEKTSIRVSSGITKINLFESILEDLQQARVVYENIENSRLRADRLGEKLTRLDEVAIGIESKKTQAELDCTPMADAIKTINTLEAQKKEAEKVSKMYSQLVLDTISEIPDISEMGQVLQDISSLSQQGDKLIWIRGTYDALADSRKDVAPKVEELKEAEFRVSEIMSEMIGDCDPEKCTLIKALGVNYGK